MSRGDHGLRVAAAQFNPRAVAHAVDGMLQVLQQRLDRLAVDLDRLLQRPALHREAKDSAVLVVAVGIANVVLHVTDDGVVPVRNIQRAVFANDGVRGTKVAIFAIEQLKPGRSPDFAELSLLAVAFAIQVVLLDAQETDRVADQEIVAACLRESGSDDRIAFAATGRNSLVSRVCILKPLPSGRTWYDLPPVPSLA